MRRAFLSVAAASSVVGLYFAARGLWIVPVVIAIEVTALGLGAARYRRSAQTRREEINVYADRLTVVTTYGRLRDEQTLPTAWLTLEPRRDDGAGLVLRMRERTLAVGGWLGAAQCEELAGLIDQALTRARRGGRTAERGVTVVWESRPAQVEARS